jgi:hypothetical protein
MYKYDNPLLHLLLLKILENIRQFHLHHLQL